MITLRSVAKIILNSKSLSRILKAKKGAGI